MKNLPSIFALFLFTLLSLFQVAPLQAEEKALKTDSVAPSPTAASEEHFDESIEAGEEDEYVDEATEDEEFTDEEESEDLAPLAGDETETAPVQDPQEEEIKDKE